VQCDCEISYRLFAPEHLLTDVGISANVSGVDWVKMGRHGVAHPGCADEEWREQRLPGDRVWQNIS